MVAFVTPLVSCHHHLIAMTDSKHFNTTSHLESLAEYDSDQDEDYVPGPVLSDDMIMDEDVVHEEGAPDPEFL